MSVAPKRPKGPPLNAMRAFEVAARHVSFVNAAEELNVTPGAISQHIKSLEGWAGTPLFRRNAQGVELTQAGQTLLPSFERAFDHLAEATNALRKLKPNLDFHIAALPSVAQLWLPKRLGEIRRHLPDVNFSVTAMETAPHLERELFDISIFFTDEVDDNNSIPICQDEIVPVCAASIFEKIDLRNGLAGFPLLQDQTWQNDWGHWAKAANVEFDHHVSGPQFSLYSIALEEAKAGAGLLMGHLCLIQEALDMGELVQIHPHSYQTGRSLVLGLPPVSRRHQDINRVIKLLCA